MYIFFKFKIQKNNFKIIEKNYKILDFFKEIMVSYNMNLCENLKSSKI